MTENTAFDHQILDNFDKSGNITVVTNPHCVRKETDLGIKERSVTSILSKNVSPVSGHDSKRKNAKIYPNPIFDPKNDVLIDPFAGMPAEMVKYYSNQSRFKFIRWILILICLFFMVWMSYSAAWTIFKLAPSLEKWQTRPIQKISLENSNLAEISKKLEKLKKSGVGTIWLDNILEVDSNLAVVNFTNINSKYGNLADFKNLLDTAHKLDLQVIFDLDLSHTSRHHPWFVASLSSLALEGPFDEFYIWENRNLESICHDLDENYTLPNNWLSIEGGPAWKYVDKKGHYFYHTFGRESPDLNLSSPKMFDQVREIIQFWLNLGVDGFSLSNVQYYFKEF